MKKSLLFLITVSIFTFNSCKDDDPELGTAPTDADAAFTYGPSSMSANIIEFRASSTGVIANWDFGNGTSAQGTSVRAIYPNKGTYIVKLTIFAKGGSASSTQEVVIVDDDPTLLSDPIYTMLTGGVDSVNGKTWVIDSAYAGHFGVGPNPPSMLGYTPEWYSATANEKSGVGLYNDRYVFNINAFGFNMITKGDIYVHTDHKDAFPGAYQNKGDYTAPFPDQLGESWLLTFDAGSDTTITVSGNSFIGFNTQVSTYRILSITENEMFLRYLDAGDQGRSWYLRLVAAGYDSGSGSGGGGGGSTGGATLPIDFETVEPTFESFGGSTDTVINNHDPRGINISGRVLQTVHGNETWAGVSVELDSKLDFSSDSLIKVKVWTQTAGAKILIKIEDKNDAMTSLEIEKTIPVAYTWVEISASFAGAAAGTYDKLALFPGWDVANAGTFYLDDIKQE